MRTPASRAGLFWLALPVMIIIGAGGGYLAAGAWAPAAERGPSASAGGHADHGDTAGGHGDAGGGHAQATAADPVSSSTRRLVLAVFVAVNAAILVAAAILRQRDRTAGRPGPRRLAHRGPMGDPA